MQVFHSPVRGIFYHWLFLVMHQISDSSWPPSMAKLLFELLRFKCIVRIFFLSSLETVLCLFGSASVDGLPPFPRSLLVFFFLSSLLLLFVLTRWFCHVSLESSLPHSSESFPSFLIAMLSPPIYGFSLFFQVRADMADVVIFFPPGFLGAVF